MLEPNAPPAAAPPPPRPAQAPSAPAPAAQPSAPPAAKTPPGAAPAEAEAAEVDDGADLAAGDDFLTDNELQGDADADADTQEREPARQTPEQRAADVPADPDGYEISIPGIEIDARDAPIIQNFTNTAADLGLSNAEANALTKFVYEQAQQMREQRLELDKQDRASVVKALDQAWGPAADANKAAAKAAWSTMSPELRQTLRGARADPNGPLLVNIPEFRDWLSSLGRRDGGVRQAGPSLHQLQNHIDEIVRVRRDDFDYYSRHRLGDKLAELEARKAALQPQAPAPGPLRGDAEREKKILHVMRTNFPKYLERGLQTELAAIRERRAGR